MRPEPDTTPFDTVSWSGGAFSFADASLSSASRASAAAVRTCGPPRLIDALEYVPPWLGVTLVSSRTVLIWLMSRSSSSAAICSSAVDAPCPSSAKPI